MAQILVWVQLLMLLMPALWLVLGALENIRAPGANGRMVAGVLDMSVMAVDEPELYAELGRNRITSPTLHKLLFGLIVTMECIVAAIMLAGVVALALAGLGFVPLEPARIIATLGSVGFTLIWSSFLVGGQWVHYWVVYKDAQITHFVMTLWGVLVTIVLFIG